MNGMSTVYAALNRLIDQVKEAYEAYRQSADDLAAHPASQDAKKRHAIAQVMLEEAIDSARSQFILNVDDGIGQMRAVNKGRRVDEPTTGEINILMALKEIPHPGDEFLYSVANTLRGNRMCLMAMDAIVRAAWADVPEHECKTYSDMLKPVMSIQAANEAIDKLRRLCDKIMKEDAETVAQRLPYASGDDLVIRELNVDPIMFNEAVSRF